VGIGATGDGSPAATGTVPAVTGATAVAAQRVGDWAAAWSAKDAEAYLSFYAPEFAPARATHAGWAADRRRKLAKPGAITVSVHDVHARALADGRVETTFAQDYVSSDFRDTSRKTLTWAPNGERWQIVGESNR
jgi:adhesin transport system outer membrane protein